jgi:hypothetical protein
LAEPKTPWLYPYREDPQQLRLGVLDQLPVPPLFPAWDPIVKRLDKTAGLAVAMAGLALEQRPDRLGVDVVHHEQLIQVEEIAALQALHDTAQLLGGDLLERVDATSTVLLVVVATPDRQDRGVLQAGRSLGVDATRQAEVQVRRVAVVLEVAEPKRGPTLEDELPLFVALGDRGQRMGEDIIALDRGGREPIFVGSALDHVLVDHCVISSATA